jgi:putative transposase
VAGVLLVLGEITRNDPPPARPDDAVGVDLGVKSLAVLSTGEIVPNPNHLEIALRELRRLQRPTARRVGPDRRTGQKPSTRWRKTQARIARLRTAVTNARRDRVGKAHHPARARGPTARSWSKTSGVAGMLKNRRLARHIAGVGMGEFRTGNSSTKPPGQGAASWSRTAGIPPPQRVRPVAR